MFEFLKKDVVLETLKDVRNLETEKSEGWKAVSDLLVYVENEMNGTPYVPSELEEFGEYLVKSSVLDTIRSMMKEEKKNSEGRKSLKECVYAIEALTPVS